MSAPELLVEAKSLQIRRGNRQWQQDFNLEAGEVAVVQGPSGCGKTTLLEALAGFVPLEAGELVIAGQSVAAWPVEKRPVSLMFQQQNFFEHLTVMENLQLGFPQARPDAQQLEKLQTAACLLGVEAYLQQKPGSLSGGQRQRLALIRTVLRPQPLVLLDEPFSALDDASRQLAGDWIREEIRSSKRAALLVSHRHEDAERLGDRQLLLS
ncbi:ATP-binding cassette domain-containing protein [Marinospirillum perlucidum]|uniref:ATP-binding cassette domain-containing protein n=1 Tax=Marinospirillum perlucidum TaxID=1982602 RepID=UPI00138FB59A|nr:ATP-binding cassette domain-containing protein [Marinospirillum perlucidum]